MKKYSLYGLWFLFMAYALAQEPGPRSPYQIILELKSPTLSQAQVQRLVSDMHQMESNHSRKIYTYLEPHLQNRQIAQWFLDEVSRELPDTPNVSKDFEHFERGLDEIDRITRIHTDLNFENTISKLRPFFISGNTPYRNFSRTLLVRMQDRQSITAMYESMEVVGIADVMDHARSLSVMDPDPAFDTQVQTITKFMLNAMNPPARSGIFPMIAEREARELSRVALQLSKKYPDVGRKLFAAFATSKMHGMYQLHFSENLSEMGEEAKKYLPRLRQFAEDRSDPKRRSYATVALGNVERLSPKETPSTVAFLRTALKDPDPSVQEGAYRALTQFPDQADQILPDLIQYLDKNPQLDKDVWRRFSDLGPKTIDFLPMLFQKMRTGSFDYIHAIESIWERFHDHPEYVKATQKIWPSILEGLNSEDRLRQINAAKEVMLLKGSVAQSAVPSLVALLKTSPTPNEAKEILRSLYRISPQDETVFLALKELAQGYHSDIKNWARNEIEAYPNLEVFYRMLDQSVQQLNETEDPQKLMEILDTLSLWGNQAHYAIPQLKRLMHHENPGVQRSALSNLGMFPESLEAFSALMEALSIPHLKVRALTQLRNIRGHEKEIFDRVLPLLTEDNSTVRDWATIVLEEKYAGLTSQERIDANQRLSKITQMKQPPDLCQSVCKMVDLLASERSQFRLPSNLGEAQWPFALTPLDGLFMVKAAPLCPKAKIYVDQMLEAFLQPSEVSHVESACPDSGFGHIEELYTRVTTILNQASISDEDVQIDSLFLYGKLFYKKLFEELLKQKNVTPMQRKNLESHLEQAKTDLMREVSQKKEKRRGEGGSYFTTYALATSVLALDPEDVNAQTHAFLTGALHPETGFIGYGPAEGRFGGDPLDSVARAVPYWLSQYRINPDDINVREGLITALENFATVAPLLASHQKTDFPNRRDSAHGGPFLWAPYYYPSVIPYATAAVEMLSQNASPAGKQRFKSIRNKLEASLLNQDVFKDPASWGREAAWAGSYQWDLPLTGLGLIPLAERCLEKEDETWQPLGILKEWPEDTSF